MELIGAGKVFEFMWWSTYGYSVHSDRATTQRNI